MLVRRLIDRLGLPLNDAAAVCLYAALVCDTGRFQYETTNAGVFALAGELVELDVPVERLSRTLFEEHRFAYLQLLAEALANAELVREQSFVWTAVTQDMLARHDVTLEEVEGLIDIVRRTAEADVACVLKEEPNGTVKVSLRSVGAADVQPRRRGARRRWPPVRRRVHLGRRDRRDRRPHPRRALTGVTRAGPLMHDGLVVVDKPAGFTSHDVVAKLRKAFGQKRVGHAGTLDPDATGVLLVGLGRVTRLLRFLQETTKAYRGTIVVRRRDRHARRRRRGPRAAADAGDRGRGASTATLRFVGELQQVPPMVSALKVGGRRLHELARAGEEVERTPRAVRIDRFDVERFEPGPFPAATVLVECSSGTYIRSLAADLGAALGGPAHLASLRRLRVGSVHDRRGASARRDRGATRRPRSLSPVDAMRGLEQVRWSTPSRRARSRTARCSRARAFAVDGPGSVRRRRRARRAARGLRAAGRGAEAGGRPASGRASTGP